MAAEFKTLESIFQMMEPADLFGAKQLSLGKSSTDTNVTKSVLDIIYNAGGRGALPFEKMIPALDDALTNASGDSAETFKKVFHVFTSDEKQPKNVDPAKNKSLAMDGKTVQDKTTFKQIVGKDFELPTDKKMGIVTTWSPYLTPAVRDAERVELFMNSIPSIHASRMVPLLEVEFAFNRVIDSATAPHETFGQVRFLLGGEKPPAGKPTAALVDARVTLDDKTKIETTTAGMEMFTSPQTLVNPSPVDRTGRYADVLDPFRPFASIESLNINISPIVGMYSYKKASLVFKLHDRSRLAEIADLVRPQIYQNAKTAPTVWLTYGWRYPFEPTDGSTPLGSRTYSDFINNNMLVREAYGVANSSFSFDNVGQVTVTLELWTKGVGEMRTTRITDTNDGLKQVRDRLESAAQRIADYAVAAGVDKPDGISREIRGYQIIESAERGVYPDWTSDEIKKALTALEASFKQGSLDPTAANKLIDELKKFYTGSDKKNLDVKTQIKQAATSVAKAKFDELTKGSDPYLPSAKKDAKHPLAAVCDNYNKQLGTSEVKEFNKHLCSFGKLFTVFVAHALKCNDSVDELQVFFHQFNDRAGTASATNIAEFPIEMPIFFDQYRQLIEAKRTENLTLEEFLKLVVDAQLSDERSLAYGFKSHFEPYNPQTPSEPKLKKGEEDKYENALAGIGTKLGPFTKPAIEMYVETTYATDGSGNDLLRRFELQESAGSTPTAATKVDHLTRIMRIHIFDKSNNPYKVQSLILKGGNGPGHGARFREVTNDFATSMNADQKDLAIAQLKRGMTLEDGRVLVDLTLTDDNDSVASAYTAIKQTVSRTMPSIIYGANGTMVVGASLASKQDPLLAVSQMQTVAAKSGKPSVGQPNGSGQDGLPLRIVPASMSLTTMGCPLLNNGQLFFVDFNTGTTADNIYILSNLTHTISPGKFESQMKMTFYDAYGRYEGAPDIIDFITKTKVPPKKGK